jgi:hypothetical protein
MRRRRRVVWFVRAGKRASVRPGNTGELELAHGPVLLYQPLV